jgi:hypothetical protein
LRAENNTVSITTKALTVTGMTVVNKVYATIQTLMLMRLPGDLDHAGHRLRLGNGVVTGGKPLLKSQALVLLSTMLRGRGQVQLVEGFSLQAGLLFKLPAVTPVLDLPR